jgi:hypothetical protein
MNALFSAGAEEKNEEKVVLVPLEKGLRDPNRKREVLDQLTGALGKTEQVLRGGLDGAMFAAYDSFKKALKAAISVVKNFRG